MRGFIYGSLVLIVGYAVLQPGAADRVGQGSNVLVNGIRRFLSGDVAGIPQRKANTAAAKPAPGKGI